MRTRLEKLRSKWPDAVLVNLPGVPDGTSASEVFSIIVDADPTRQKKMAEWIFNAWSTRQLLWEDICQRSQSKTFDTLSDFERLKSKIANPTMRSLMKYKSPGQLWMAVKPWLDVEEKSGVKNSGKTDKKLDHAKASSESISVTLDSGMTVSFPLTQFASTILGRNTKWCTAAIKNNMFKDYDSCGSLIIFTLPNGERFQGHGVMKRARQSNTKHITEAYYQDDMDILEKLEMSFMDETDTTPNPSKMQEISPFLPEIMSILAKSQLVLAPLGLQKDEKFLAELALSIEGIIRKEGALEKTIPVSPEEGSIEETFQAAGILGLSKNGEICFKKPDHESWLSFVYWTVQKEISPGEKENTNKTLSHKDREAIGKLFSNMDLSPNDIRDVISHIRPAPSGSVADTLIGLLQGSVFSKKNIDATIEVLREDNPKWSDENIISYIDSLWPSIRLSKEALMGIKERLPELANNRDNHSNLFRSWFSSQVFSSSEDLSRALRDISKERLDKASTFTEIQDAMSCNIDAVMDIMSHSHDSEMVSALSRSNLAVPEFVQAIKRVAPHLSDTEVMLNVRELIVESLGTQGVYKEDQTTIMKALDSHLVGATTQDIAREIDGLLDTNDETTAIGQKCIAYATRNGIEVSHSQYLSRRTQGLLELLSKNLMGSEDIWGDKTGCDIASRNAIFTLGLQPIDEVRADFLAKYSSLVARPSKDYIEKLKALSKTINDDNNIKTPPVIELEEILVRERQQDLHALKKIALLSQNGPILDRYKGIERQTSKQVEKLLRTKANMKDDSPGVEL